MCKNIYIFRQIKFSFILPNFAKKRCMFWKSISENQRLCQASFRLFGAWRFSVAPVKIFLQKLCKHFFVVFRMWTNAALFMCVCAPIGCKMTARVKICKLIFANTSLCDILTLHLFKQNTTVFFATFEWMIHSVATGYNSHIAAATHCGHIFGAEINVLSARDGHLMAH